MDDDISLLIRWRWPLRIFLSLGGASFLIRAIDPSSALGQAAGIILILAAVGVVVGIGLVVWAMVSD